MASERTQGLLDHEYTIVSQHDGHIPFASGEEAKNARKNGESCGSDDNDGDD